MERKPLEPRWGSAWLCSGWRQQKDFAWESRRHISTLDLWVAGYSRQRLQAWPFVIESRRSGSHGQCFTRGMTNANKLERQEKKKAFFQIKMAIHQPLAETRWDAMMVSMREEWWEWGSRKFPAHATSRDDHVSISLLVSIKIERTKHLKTPFR